MSPRMRVLQDATAAMERGNGEERRGCLLTSACGSEGDHAIPEAPCFLGVEIQGEIRCWWYYSGHHYGYCRSDCRGTGGPMSSPHVAGAILSSFSKPRRQACQRL